MRRTRNTLKRLPPKARKVAELGNELDRLSRTAHTLAETLADAEIEQVANNKRRVTMPGCAAHPEGWQPDCKGCYRKWATNPPQTEEDNA